MEVWLLNAAHMKAVPGRKTDVKDAEWIAQLLEHGLLRPSFVPPPEIRRLRMLTRRAQAVIGWPAANPSGRPIAAAARRGPGPPRAPLPTALVAARSPSRPANRCAGVGRRPAGRRPRRPPPEVRATVGNPGAGAVRAGPRAPAAALECFPRASLASR